MKPKHISAMINRLVVICKRTPACLDDDKRLIYEVWCDDFYKKHGYDLNLPWETFQQLSVAATIVRGRRSCVTLKLLRPPKKTQEARHRDAEDMKNGINNIKIQKGKAILMTPDRSGFLF